MRVCSFSLLFRLIFPSQYMAPDVLGLKLGSLLFPLASLGRCPKPGSFPNVCVLGQFPELSHRMKKHQLSVVVGGWLTLWWLSSLPCHLSWLHCQCFLYFVVPFLCFCYYLLKYLSEDLPLGQRGTFNLFCKTQNSKYFRLHVSCLLCLNHSTLPLEAPETQTICEWGSGPALKIVREVIRQLTIMVNLPFSLCLSIFALYSLLGQT